MRSLLFTFFKIPSMRRLDLAMCAILYSGLYDYFFQKTFTFTQCTYTIIHSIDYYLQKHQLKRRGLHYFSQWKCDKCELACSGVRYDYTIYIQSAPDATQGKSSSYIPEREKQHDLHSI
uniref:Uncharacterized protein n=1 Tax=Cacopsylla melanoneura TaxID=428564 RepID=A0A8D8X1H2_9HEMI